MFPATAPNRGGAPGRVTVAVVGVMAGELSLMILRRIALSLRQFWVRSRDHAREARILGSSTVTADVVVVTTGALARLDEAELAAVLAHEQAHLSGRHLQLMMLLRPLTGAMPRLPLLRNAVESVGRLVEMCADDVAARRHGRHTLLRGLLTLAGQPRLAGNALGAADTAALARAVRLASPVRRGARLRQRILLTATLAALATAPFVVTVSCHH